MNYIYTQPEIILFEYEGRNWEIKISDTMDEDYIQNLIHKRILRLDVDFNIYKNYDKSNLFTNWEELDEKNKDIENAN